MAGGVADGVTVSGTLEPPRTGDPTFFPGDVTDLMLVRPGPMSDLVRDWSCLGGTLRSTLIRSRASLVSSALRLGDVVQLLFCSALNREGVAAADALDAERAVPGGVSAVFINAWTRSEIRESRNGTDASGLAGGGLRLT